MVNGRCRRINWRQHVSFYSRIIFHKPSTINHLTSSMFILKVERPGGPGGYKSALAHHLPYAIISCMALLAAALLPLNPIPVKVCIFLRVTGYPCPSCGFTRGFVAMAHGLWADVWYSCPLAVLLYAATALVFAVNAAALICRVRLRPGIWLKWRASAWAGIFCFFGLLILLNWIYRLALGLK